MLNNIIPLALTACCAQGDAAVLRVYPIDNGMWRATIASDDHVPLLDPRDGEFALSATGDCASDALEGLEAVLEQFNWVDTH